MLDSSLFKLHSLKIEYVIVDGVSKRVSYPAAWSRVTYIKMGVSGGPEVDIHTTASVTPNQSIAQAHSNNKIFDDGSGRLTLKSSSNPSGIAYIELIDKGGFYSVVSAFNGQERGKIVWSGRRQFISSEGFDVSGAKRAFAATSDMSNKPAAGTDQSQNTSSTRSLETLADQTTDGSIT